MNYEEFEDANGNKHIAIFNEDGSRTTFPAELDNPNYVQFLEQLSGTL